MRDNRIGRPFIERLRHDPRMRAMVDGWIAQAALAVEGRIDTYRVDPRRIAHEAAEEAIRLALSFVLDEDGEYKMVCQERDRIMESVIKLNTLAPKAAFVAQEGLS